LSENSPKRLISEEEIRAVYAWGEDAVIELVEGLMAGLSEKVEKLESRIAEIGITPMLRYFQRSDFIGKMMSLLIWNKLCKLSDRLIRMSGLFGGGLPIITEDVW
jgi:hypothetical protein